MYECEVSRVIELEGSHLFLSNIVNIQIDKDYENMNMAMIGITKVKPVIYAPYNYFTIGKKIGECGEWKKVYKTEENH